MADKKSFVMYKSWKELFRSLPAEMAGELIQAIFSYQDGEDVSFENPALSAIFQMITNKMSEDEEKYQKRVESNKKNGKKGGRPKEKNDPVGLSESENNPVGLSESKTKRKNPDNDTDTDNDIDNVYVNDTERENTARAKKPKPVKHRYGEYKNVLLSDDELAKLQNEYGDDLTQRMIRELSGYISSKGAKYSSHYATIRNWIRRDKERGQPRKPAAEENPFLGMLIEMEGSG